MARRHITEVEQFEKGNRSFKLNTVSTTYSLQIDISKILRSYHLTAELNLPPLHSEAGRLGGLSLIEVQVLVLRDLAAVLER